MKTNIENCITSKVSIQAREDAIRDLSTAVEVLLLIDGYMSNMPQERLHAFDGGVMTMAELRERVQSAITLLRPEYANLIQDRLYFEPATAEKGTQ